MNKFSKSSDFASANYRRYINSSEADKLCNQLARATIRSVKRENNGECYLGIVNPIFNKDMNGLKKYYFGKIRNFTCDFVLPKYDKYIDERLKDINKNGISITKLDEIWNRVHAIGGHYIFWS